MGGRSDSNDFILLKDKVVADVPLSPLRTSRNDKIVNHQLVSESDHLQPHMIKRISFNSRAGGGNSSINHDYIN